MQIAPDVLELVEVLNEEGFGALAGEVLTEISLGREVDDPQEVGSEAAEMREMPIRESIPTAEQLDVALDLIVIRLVEPMRLLANAEHIAGELAFPHELERTPSFSARRGDGEGERSDGASADPMKIRFRLPSDRKGGSLDRFEAPGTTRTADILLRVLDRIREAPR